MPPPSSGSKNKPSAWYLLHAGFCLADPENGGDMLLLNVGCLSTDYKTFYSRTQTLHNDRCEKLKSYRIATIRVDNMFHYSLFCEGVPATVKYDMDPFLLKKNSQVKQTNRIEEAGEITC
jgi:hypothetical protein